MKFQKTYPPLDMNVNDMINGAIEPLEMAHMVEFKTLIKCGASITNLNIVDIILEIVEDGVVWPMICLEAEVNGDVYGFTISIDRSELIHFIQYATKNGSRLLADNKIKSYILP